MFDTKTMKSSDEGVSPVIGVILMVAITVILAAVIGTFVLDLAGNLEQSAQASATFDEDTTNDTVTVQMVSMQSADFVELRGSADQGDFNSISGNIGTDAGGNTDTHTSDSTGLAATSITVDLESVGNSAEFGYAENASGNASGSITAVGYLEGSGSVLQTYNYGDS